MRVLVLNDDSGPRSTLQKLLAERGHEVMRVADVEAAGAAHPEPALLVVESEGIAAAAARCRALRALPQTSRSYLLAIAAVPGAASGELAELIAAGADDALPAPVEAGAFDLRLAVAARRLDRRAARRTVEDSALRRIVDTMSDGLAVEEALRLTQFSIDRSAEPAFWFHPDGRFFYVNEAASRLLGYEREELLALRVQDVVPDFPDDRFAVLAEQIRQQSAITLETQHRGKDGRLFPAEITVNHLRFGGGEYFCGFTRDVSARKRVEQALRESEERYRSLFEGVPVGLYRTTPAGDMLEANSEMARILGYPSREALMGINAAELYLEPEERARWQQAIDAEHTVQTPETRLWRRDGTVIWVRLSVQAVRDEHGAIRRYDGAMEDVTERRLARQALLASEERFRALVQNASDMISILSPDGSVLYESPSHERVLGPRRDEDPAGGEIRLRPGIYDQIHPDDRLRMTEAIRCLLDHPEATVTLEYRRQHRDGSWRDLESTASNLLTHPAVLGIVLNSHDITERKCFEEQLRHDALHDVLTGLPNRVLFMENLKRSMERSRRDPVWLTSVLFFDIDRFKIVNDSLGHLLGDELLIQVSRAITSVLRPSDLFARVGGDEFVVLLEGEHNLGDATQVAHRIHDTLAKPILLGGHELYVSASIGIAVATPDYERPEDLLRDADTAMYRAKASGRACHVVFNQDMHRSMMSRLRLESDLRRALDQGQFRVYYQPIVALDSGELTGYEALVRWLHPRRGLILPDEFLAVAEETGAIVPIGLYVLTEACRELHDLKRRHPEHRALRLTVNLSHKQFFESGLTEQIGEILSLTGFDSRYLGLEVTEGVLIRNAEWASARFDHLKALGVQIYLDDFGTGYSSLNYLHRFPVDVLKIDRSFVSGLGRAPADLALVEAMIHIAHQLGMEVVAEGVETAEQVAELRSLGCEYGQGRYFSMAQPSPIVEPLVKTTAG